MYFVNSPFNIVSIISCCFGKKKRFALLLNPQIKVTVDGDWEALMQDKPALIIMNHSSFFDFFVVSSVLPLKFILMSHPRTVMSSSLAKIPFFGNMIGKQCGSFLVHFKAKGAGFGKGDASDYSVDRALQLIENDKMDAHLNSGGVIAFCPEGGMNKKPEEGLLPFRRGSFLQAVKYRTPIWGFSMIGCTTCWPRNSMLGGYPSHVHIKIRRIMVPALNQEPVEVANTCHDVMENDVKQLRTQFLDVETKKCK